MVSTKWYQGIEDGAVYSDIRKEVFLEELGMNNRRISDIYDHFAYNLVLYEDSFPAATGRLLFKDGKYMLDNICVRKDFRHNRYADLLIRMLVRKAYDIGADKTYVITDEKYSILFENIGFKIDGDLSFNEEKVLMVKIGDVGGYCC